MGRLQRCHPGRRSYAGAGAWRSVPDLLRTGEIPTERAALESPAEPRWNLTVCDSRADGASPLSPVSFQLGAARISSRAPTALTVKKQTRPELLPKQSFPSFRGHQAFPVEVSECRGQARMGCQVRRGRLRDRYMPQTHIRERWRRVPALDAIDARVGKQVGLALSRKPVPHHSSPSCVRISHPAHSAQKAIGWRALVRQRGQSKTQSHWPADTRLRLRTLHPLRPSANACSGVCSDWRSPSASSTCVRCNAFRSIRADLMPWRMTFKPHASARGNRHFSLAENGS